MILSKKLAAVASTILTLLLCSEIQSQTTTPIKYNQGFRLGFGLNGGIPSNKKYDWALGGDVRLQYDLSKKTSLTLTTGFTNLFHYSKIENETLTTKDLGYIPAKAGFKAFIWEDRYYVLGEAGAAFAVTNNYDKTSFVWSPGFGFATKYVDISVRYEDVPKFKTNQIALRLAYGFKL